MESSKDFPLNFYRVTVKGLYVKDDKLLMVQESTSLSGKWEMPGGGLDFGEDVHEGLRREIREEMGLEVTKISKAPLYVWTHKYEQRRNMDWFYALVVAYRIELPSLDFTPSEECEAIKFCSKEDLRAMNLAGQSTKLYEIFDPEDFKGDF